MLTMAKTATKFVIVQTRCVTSAMVCASVMQAKLDKDVTKVSFSHPYMVIVLLMSPIATNTFAVQRALLYT